MGAAGLGRDAQGAAGGRREVLVQAPDRRPVDHVERPRHREGGDWQAAGQRLEEDQAEGVGAAGKDEDVGRGDVARQVVARLGAGEDDPRIAPPQATPCAPRRRASAIISCS